MSEISRRKLLTAGLFAGASGLAAAVAFGRRLGLVPPDSAGIWGPGETLTYGAHRLLGKNSTAREFSAEMISKAPFANEVTPLGEKFEQLQANGFADWRVDVGGMVAKPMSLSIADIKRFPESRQITEVACEEGWSYIAQWIGTPLANILTAAGALPAARYLVYYSHQEDWWESIDMDEAMHPQTLLTWGMNDGELPVVFGGPLRLRVPRQLGYKSVKYVTRLTVTDSMKGFGKGLGSVSPETGYSWYAGI
ncbi:MAG: molybdopterin-dependent oxidoreductase [Gemmatimonadaceae bacterium]